MAASFSVERRKAVGPVGRKPLKRKTLDQETYISLGILTQVPVRFKKKTTNIYGDLEGFFQGLDFLLIICFFCL